MNPMQMMQAFKNPQQFIQNMMGNSHIASNPMARNAMEMFQKGDIDGVKSLAENLAKERGTTVDNVKSGIMQQFRME